MYLWCGRVHTPGVHRGRCVRSCTSGVVECTHLWGEGAIGSRLARLAATDHAVAMGTLEPQDLDFAESAPVIAEHVAVVDGTAAEVWAAILDYPGWTGWFPGVKGCEPTSDPSTGIGSTRRVTLGGGVVVDERFIAWDEGERWAFTALTGPPGFGKLVERVTLRQLGPRLTEVTYRMAIGPKPTALTPMFKLLRPVIEKNLRVALRNLNGVVVAARAS